MAGNKRTVSEIEADLNNGQNMITVADMEVLCEERPDVYYHEQQNFHDGLVWVMFVKGDEDKYHFMELTNLFGHCEPTQEPVMFKMHKAHEVTPHLPEAGFNVASKVPWYKPWMRQRRAC